MYTLGVRRNFIARHFLIGGDWGPENFPNSHHYILELQLEGSQLDQHGYLVDIVDMEKHLDEIVNYYKEQMLNDKPKRTYPSTEYLGIESCVVGERVRVGGVSR
jgi:6-pyruvoyltetrahydropterin/6-carboxytetrahydropterin synthase